MGRFVLPDIHGCLDKLEKILLLWNPETHVLVQLGDLLDRGENSLEVLRLMMKLKREGKAEIIRGNHEDLFLSFLDDPKNEGDFYFNSGGRITVKSFFKEDLVGKKTATYIADSLKDNYYEEIEFIKNLPLYSTWENWVFVHAGVNFSLNNWRNSTENDFNYLDHKRFVYEKNPHSFRFVVGHTQTSKINKNKKNDIWISDCKTKFMLDGGASSGGQLNALVIDDNQEYSFLFV